MRCVQFDKGLFLKNRTTLVKKRSVWPSNTSICIIACHSRLFGGQILVQKFTKFDRVCKNVLKLACDRRCVYAVDRAPSVNLLRSKFTNDCL